MYASPEKDWEKKTEITNLTNATVAKETNTCYLYNIALWIFVCSCLMIWHRFFVSCLTLFSGVLFTHTHMREPQIVSHVWKLYKILYEFVHLYTKHMGWNLYFTCIKKIMKFLMDSFLVKIVCFYLLRKPKQWLLSFDNYLLCV